MDLKQVFLLYLTERVGTLLVNKKARYIAIAGFSFIYEALKYRVQAMRVVP